jgi:aminoglycoside 6'-N-acetyltransferase
MTLTFEPVSVDDLELLVDWRGMPHVERWWPGLHDRAALERELGPIMDGTDPTRAFICRSGARAIGYAQAYRLADEAQWRAVVTTAIGELRAVGIDYFIGEPDLIGRGLGAAMIASFVTVVWATFSEPAVVVAVQQGNAPSWRALERAGFTRVWHGHLASDDPSDQGPAYLYRADRPA